MSTPPTLPYDQSFNVNCGYCFGIHTVTLDRSTLDHAYGPLYYVTCPGTGYRFGVHAVTNSRVSN